MSTMRNEAVLGVFQAYASSFLYIAPFAGCDLIITPFNDRGAKRGKAWRHRKCVV